MKVTRLSVPDLLLIEPDVFEDARGFFMETFHAERYAAFGICEKFVQDNHSRSLKGTLRGLHYQLGRPQGKLVRVTQGAVFDVAVDVRKNSPTFGRWAGAILSGENKHQLYIPKGFAHGFCVMSDVADFLYKCTDYYSPEEERGIIWNDPDLGIGWPVNNPLISEKDRRYKRLSDMDDDLPAFGG